MHSDLQTGVPNNSSNYSSVNSLTFNFKYIEHMTMENIKRLPSTEAL